MSITSYISRIKFPNGMVFTDPKDIEKIVAVMEMEKQKSKEIKKEALCGDHTSIFKSNPLTETKGETTMSNPQPPENKESKEVNSPYFAYKLTAVDSGATIFQYTPVCAIPGIKYVIYGDRSTTIVWGDNTKTTVNCGEGEHYDRYTGFMAAVCKKMFGSTTAAKKMSRRLDKAEIDRVRREKYEAKRAQRKQEQATAKARRERAIVRRMAKEIVYKKKAKDLADEMLFRG